MIRIALLIIFITQGENNLNLKNGIAIQGYDPVSYFLKDGPKEGSKEFSYKLEGAVYYFANDKNRNLFIEAPEKYMPQYGGWCAFAMGDTGEKVKIDPETFKIKDGKLFLFYNFFFNNTLTDWNENEDELKKKADENWMRINRE